MIYDLGKPHASYSDYEESIDYWLGRGLPASRLVPGVPFYSSTGSSYEEIINSCGSSAAYVDNGCGHDYNGITTIQAKTTLAIQNKCLGIMIWEISDDSPGTYSLLKAIYDTVY